ncbi:hypothetical protein DFP72DRAFT_1077364 [Ephemerocybe angulata]|uniref:Uncharacterized protein n=1 Tax=Ephemerocybe angulata TaxID=980116 RepID=A0A8H6HEM7_9AGAR|nr:hypothetical protein DFP72DRAFT_1077364 [Tulosesus angulatus]
MPRAASSTADLGAETTDTASKRIRRGNRSPAAEARRKGKLRAKILAKLKDSELVTLESYPDEFLKIQTSGKAVRNRIKKHGLDKVDLDIAPDTGMYVVELDEELRKELLPEHPPQVVMRCSVESRLNIKDLTTRLLEVWDALIANGMVLPDESGSNRTAGPGGLHLGSWQVAAKEPMFTSDTKRHMDDPILWPLMTTLLNIIKEELAPVVAELTKSWCSNTWAKQSR